MIMQDVNNCYKILHQLDEFDSFSFLITKNVFSAIFNFVFHACEFKINRFVLNS